MPLDTALTADRSFIKVGTRPPRPDGVDKVTGRARYGADMATANMLVGMVLRSPHGHARIVSINTKKSRGSGRREGRR